MLQGLCLGASAFARKSRVTSQEEGASLAPKKAEPRHDGDAGTTSVVAGHELQQRLGRVPRSPAIVLAGLVQKRRQGAHSAGLIGRSPQ